MKIFAFIYFFLFISTVLFFVVGILVEKHVPEDKPFMKWWRKHVVGKAPDDVDI